MNRHFLVTLFARIFFEGADVGIFFFFNRFEEIFCPFFFTWGVLGLVLYIRSCLDPFFPSFFYLSAVPASLNVQNTVGY